MIKLQSNKNIIAATTVDEVQYLLLQVTKKTDLPMVLRGNKALILRTVDGNDLKGFGIVFSRNRHDIKVPGVAYLDEDLSYLEEGDVIRVYPKNNSVRAIYRANAHSNFLLVTEQCNSFCLMCSQPPRNIDDSHLIEELIEAVPLIDRGASEIGITGGEPTLLGDRFFTLIRTIKNYLPDTSLHILTNGRSFSDSAMVSSLAKINHQDLMLGIPLYSDLSHLHDFVVQADGAFDETIRGILNLKRYSQKVEIRVVIHLQTYKRLPNLAEFIGRNLQFVDHVALMGLEITGFTRANLDELWVEPNDYAEELSKAVSILSRYNIDVSIYNLQRCLLPQHLWPYAVKSISDWKNKYYAECDKCLQKSECGGFFASSDIKRSEYIKAIES